MENHIVDYNMRRKFIPGGTARLSMSRPPHFSKIFTKICNVSLDKCTEKYDILSSSQYGFRTSMYINGSVRTNLKHYICLGPCIVGVFIVLKNTFDTSVHNFLFGKLEAYGIRIMANEWLRGYLHNTLQYVSIDDSNSFIY